MENTKKKLLETPPIRMMSAGSAYEAIGEVIEGAYGVALDYGTRVVIRGFKGRCGCWHYFAIPMLEAPRYEQLLGRELLKRVTELKKPKRRKKSDRT